MKFKNSEGQNVTVAFSHSFVNSGEEKHIGKRITAVTVEIGDQSHLGYAICHPNDNFCKETGRRVALKRGLEVFNKQQRTEVWDQYRIWGKQRF